MKEQAFEREIEELLSGKRNHIVIKENESGDMSAYLSRISGLEIAERKVVDDELYFVVRKEKWPLRRILFVGTMIALPIVLIAITIVYFAF